MQGTLATATGLGASASNYPTGLIVSRYGFDAGFTVLAAIAGVALAFYALAMPETRPEANDFQAERLDPGGDRATMGHRDRPRTDGRMIPLRSRDEP